MAGSMKSPASLVLLTVILIGYLQNVDGLNVCKRKTFLQKIRFTCPEPGQASDMIYCCGDDDDIGGQYCCRSIINDKAIEAFANNIGSIIATIAGIIGFIIILLIICCCVCPCCFLYKRRNRGGQVYRSTTVPAANGSSGVNVTVVPPPNSAQQTGPPPPGFVQNSYPMHPIYPNQQPGGGYPPQQPYYPPQQGYPPQGYYPDQPPPYPQVATQEAYQKQSPYNPSY